MAWMPWCQRPNLTPSFESHYMAILEKYEQQPGERLDYDIDFASLFLSALGDSLVLVEDDDIIKVHVHTNNPGRALEEALTYGALQTVKIENMRNQHSEILSEHDHAAESTERKVSPPEKPFGFVSVCAGEGLAAVFRDLGCDGIISGGQTMNPSTDDILRAINRTPAETVFVYPNNKNIIMAADQCVPLTSKEVVVIPTKTVPQGVSALLAFSSYTDPRKMGELRLPSIWPERADSRTVPLHMVLPTHA